jgi:hypothetical protein
MQPGCFPYCMGGGGEWPNQNNPRLKLRFPWTKPKGRICDGEKGGKGKIKIKYHVMIPFRSREQQTASDERLDRPVAQSGELLEMNGRGSSLSSVLVDAGLNPEYQHFPQTTSQPPSRCVVPHKGIRKQLPKISAM